MPNTSSFKTGDELYKDRACFAYMNGRHNREGNIIIIEKNKQFYSKKLIYEWLTDLKEIGLPIDNWEKGDKEEILINLKPCEKKFKYITLTMLVRALWEGKASKCSDNFYHVVEGYFKLKKYNIGENNMERICVAHNYMVALGNVYYNSNHILCRQVGCKVFKTLRCTHKDYPQVNGTFSRPNHKPFKFKVPVRWTKKKLTELYNESKK